jgi:Acyl-CoA dehydrogenases
MAGSIIDRTEETARRARSTTGNPAASHAKLVACEAADLAARTSIQVHGAMGYSWEVDVHLFLKRTLALTHAWGDPAFHRARVAERVFRHPLGPEHTFSSETSHV